MLARTLIWRQLGNRGRLSKALVVLAGLLLVAGCTAQGLYDGVQSGVLRECIELPPPQIDPCLQANDVSYEDYLRERAEVDAPAREAGPGPVIASP